MPGRAFWRQDSADTEDPSREDARTVGGAPRKPGLEGSFFQVGAGDEVKKETGSWVVSGLVEDGKDLVRHNS